MLDLDALEAFYIERANTQRGRAVLSVVAELRAAREVIEAAREVGHGPTALHWNPQCVQCQALANYDKAMGGK